MSSDRVPWRAETVVSRALAVGFLVLCWAMLTRSFWPAIVSPLLRVAQAVRGAGAVEVESLYLDVRNNSSAEGDLIRQTVAQLDADYAALQAVVGASPTVRIPVLLADGTGPALTGGRQLIVAYDDGTVDLSSAPYLLVLLSEGDLDLPGLDLFVEGGYAVSVVERAGLAQPLLGQPTDAWVTLMEQSGVRPSLAEAWDVGMPANAQDVVDMSGALLVAGSFVGWVADVQGDDAVDDLRYGMTVEETLGLSLQEAEQRWWADIEAEKLDPRPCLEALPPGSPLRSFCTQFGDL